MSRWSDGAPAARRRLAREVGEICHGVGFFYLVNHPVPARVSRDYIAMAREFFALPLAVREAIDKRASPQFRGWERLGSELTGNRVDYREQIDIGVEREALVEPDPWYRALIGPNQWPPESALPGFRACVEDYFARLSDLARELLRIMSLALGLDEEYIERCFGAEPSPYLKLIRYPPTQDGGQGVGIHKDSGFLTLLLQDETPGLEAQANDDTWYRVDPLAGSFVVNTGELLQLITSNYFIATPHRVINDTRHERLSSAFFYSPDLDTRLDPLPVAPELLARVEASARHRDEGLMASRAQMAAGTANMASRDRPLVFGEKYWQRWIRSYPEIARRYYPDRME
ncbi:MAG: 2-oxoglutarate and iron-dependent oxygenase domain-containing protein [Gammaproteobacteria bacterium]|nr:2-oxoglutarate and iron-dependent oxygenase domain-containing protein [Gammaproteobacteria bacterium]